MQDELQITYIPVSKLKEHEGNAKIHDEANVEAIKASIERFGMCDPIGVWTNQQGEHVIIEGHGRKMALEQLDWYAVPCIILNHLTDEERRAYALAHNQTTLMSGFDLDALSLEMEALEGFEMSDFGFDLPEESEPVEYEPSDEEPPEDFPEYDEEIETEHCCPKCGWEW